jgi:hypothetical protein
MLVVGRRMAPKPSAEMLTPVFPNGWYCMVCSSWLLVPAHKQIRPDFRILVMQELVWFILLIISVVSLYSII